MNNERKLLHARIKELLPFTDSIIEIRKVDGCEIKVDIASDQWETKSIHGRLDFLFDLFKGEEFYKKKIFICCPVNIKDFKEMKRKEMGLK